MTTTIDKQTLLTAMQQYGQLWLKNHPQTNDDNLLTECECGHYVNGTKIPEASEVLTNCTELDDGDYDHWFVCNAVLPTHATNKKSTLLFVRLQYMKELCPSFGFDFHCEICAVNPTMSKKARVDVAKAYGYDLEEFDSFPRQQQAIMMIEYGTYAVLWQGSGDAKIELLKEANKGLQECHTFGGFKLDSPMNAMGTTGWQRMKGEL